MRVSTIVLVTLSTFLFVGQAHAKSCSFFAGILSFDEASSSVKLKVLKGSETKFFPKPEGSPTASRLPAKCKGKALKQESYAVKTTGGRMTVTQVRENFSNKMMNETDDPKWLPALFKELNANRTKVLVVLRPPTGKKSPLNLKTIYLPITVEERKEIERLESQGEDL
jgi:hypothetical protein